MLRFFGRNSAFNQNQNSAFFIDGNDLVLLDCPMSSFLKIKKTGLERLSEEYCKTQGMSKSSVEKIYVLITHTHGDHVGGIGMLIFYSAFVFHIPVCIIAPSEAVRKDIEYLLDSIEGCQKDSYELDIASNINKWDLSSVMTSHVETLKNKCFGYMLNIRGKKIIYTGDTNTLAPFKDLADENTILYTESSAFNSGVHLYIDDNIELLKSLTDRGTSVYIMHLDDEEYILNKIKDSRIKTAVLFEENNDKGETKMNNAEKQLEDIFTISDLLYKDMSNGVKGDHSAIFEHITDLGRTLVNADRASFWKWDKASHTLWTTAATNSEKIVIPDDKGLVAKALSLGQVIVTNDPYNDPNFNAEVDKKTGYVTKSILTMPVDNIKGEFIGAYQVINKMDDDGKFDIERDCKKLSLVAAICGLALESDVFLEESHTDRLTRLKNRMGFFNDFESTYSKVLAENRKISLFICDIDKFKRVNDTYGHNAGDEVLRDVAGILLKNCKMGDGMYRWGGEEFIMIMVDTDINECAAKAEELRLLVEDTPSVYEGTIINHTLSFGVSSFDPAKTIEENISDADAKLYTAKETGRNKVVV